jgi:hypothetical protein
MPALDVPRAVFDEYQKNVIINPYRHGGGGGDPPGAEYGIELVYQNSDEANRTAYTFAGATLGDADAERVLWVIGAVRKVANSTPPTVTVGGNSTTAVLSVSSNSYILHVDRLSLATGTSGDLVLTYNATCDRCAVAVLASYGASATPYDSETGVSLTSYRLDDLTTPSGDSIVVAAVCNNGVASNSTTWSGGVTEVCDIAVELLNLSVATMMSTTSQALDVRGTPASANKQQAALLILQ